MKQIRLKQGVDIIKSCDVCPYGEPFYYCRWGIDLEEDGPFPPNCPLEEYVMKEPTS
jgi:hypothetical protein